MGGGEGSRSTIHLIHKTYIKQYLEDEQDEKSLLKSAFRDSASRIDRNFQ